MAKRTWIGGDSKQAQTESFEVTVGHASDTYDFLVTNESGTLVIDAGVISGAGHATEATVATNMANAWNNSTHPLTLGITATTSDETVTLTSNADTVGIPFYVKAAVAGGNGGTIDGVTSSDGDITQANRGPHDWNDPNNWREGQVPVATVHVAITGSIPIQYGFDQSGVALGEFTTVPGSSVPIGNETHWLRIDPDAFYWHGTGTSYVDLGLTSITDTTPTVFTTGGGPGVTSGGLYYKHSSTGGLVVYGGNVKLAITGGDNMTLGELVVRGGYVQLGSSAKVLTLTQFGGEILSQSIMADSPRDVFMYGGVCTLDLGGTETVASATIEGGTLIANNDGTITTLHAKGGRFSNLDSHRELTVTTFNANASAALDLNMNLLTLTNGIALTGRSRVTLDTV